MDLTSQMLMVNYFCSFKEVFPPVFIYNLNHLTCTMMDEGT